MRKTFLIIVLVLFCLAVIPISGSERNWTVDVWQKMPNILGTPPREVKWNSNSRTCAFLWDEKGFDAFDIYLYHPVLDKVKRLTDFSSLSDDGKTKPGEQISQIKERMRISGGGIDAYVWHPDGERIFFSYAGDLFKADASDGKIIRLTDTKEEEIDPKISPDGIWLSFIRANDIWIKNLKTGAEVQLTVTGSKTMLNGIGDYIALEEIGRHTSYYWSPKSNSIAYVSADISPVRELLIPDYRGRYVTAQKQRRPVAGGANAIHHVKVVQLDNKKEYSIKIPGSIEELYVTQVKWTPNGSALLVVVEERNYKNVHFYLADTSTSHVKLLYTDTDAKWVNIHNQFTFFAKDSKTLYSTSEASGYNHLYSYNLKTGAKKQLTRGNWEITSINGIDEDEIYFTSTRISPAQRHLDTLDTETGKLSQKTFVEGWHECSISPNLRYVMDIYRSDRLPGDLFHFELDSPLKRKQVTKSASGEAGKYKILEPIYITLKNRTDGKTIFARMWRPEKPIPGKKYPAIIAVHGGGYSQSVRKSWRYSDIFHNILASRGFIVLDIDYRGSSGYGRDWRTDVYLKIGEIDLDDIITGAEYLKALPYISKNRVGIWGWSYGGFMTNLAMLKTPDVFKAGVAVAPVNKWENYDSHYTEERFGLPTENPQEYRVANPVSFAANLKGKLLMIHGMIDDNVHFQDTVQLMEKLIKKGKQFEIMTYPGGLHGIRGPVYRKHLFRKIIDFFTENL